MPMRSPICSVLGHVDHGKTSLLDRIRGTAVTAGEAGGITQAIGASIIPLDIIKKVCGELLIKLNMQFTIPGILFIDTPGHAAFTSLRKRGGSMADIAVLVVDINEGFKPQTVEAIEILKTSKTPFVIAANKIDLIHGFQVSSGFLIPLLQQQGKGVQDVLDRKMYELVGSLYEKFSVNAERFDRVEDYTKQVAIVPCSAKTGIGIPELIMVLAGLAQKYLEQSLQCAVDGPAKGSIMEVKEEKGLGLTIDVILYDGKLRIGDTLVLGGLDKPIVTRVKAMFEPMPLSEMRDKKAKFKPVKEVVAATGVKISGPDMEGVVAGMPVRSCAQAELESVKEEIQKEIESIVIDTDAHGITIKTDNLGSLEALITLLREKGFPIRHASIGAITKKDITGAESNFDKDPLLSAILSFNIPVPEDVSMMSKKVKIISSNIIYRLIEEYEAWRAEASKNIEALQLDAVVRPCKIQLLSGYVFRQSNPAIMGIEVVGGVLRTGMPLMDKNGRELTAVKTIEVDKESVSELKRGKQAAVSFPGVTVGRQINEGDMLYSSIPEEDFVKIKELKKVLSADETEVIKEIALIMRQSNPVWGV
ncbi:MAG TPA: translation initiation factor IF-2 [Candidatus Nanoarchaeia archaeon]|nr:translation initiation factor IF-2 [Candidatus Nanoarchaeia archaeon]